MKHLVNRIKSNFGTNNQGYIRIDPIINPLYLGYSHRRGLTYKFDVRGSYDFSDNCDMGFVLNLDIHLSNINFILIFR